MKGAAILSGFAIIPATHPNAMAVVHFTANLRRHVQCPRTEAEGATVCEVLEDVFSRFPLLRVAIRKGLFPVIRDNGPWQVPEPSFLGNNVSAVLHHPVSRHLPPVCALRFD